LSAAYGERTARRAFDKAQWGMNTPPLVFLTATETARACNSSLSALLRAVSDGRITPAAKAGAAKNGPILFFQTDVPAITAALTGEALATAGRPHQCGSLAEIQAAGEAFMRAASEVSR
jgi:hypothetical protein